MKLKRKTLDERAAEIADQYDAERKRKQEEAEALPVTEVKYGQSIALTFPKLQALSKYGGYGHVFLTVEEARELREQLRLAIAEWER